MLYQYNSSYVRSLSIYASIAVSGKCTTKYLLSSINHHVLEIRIHFV